MKEVQEKRRKDAIASATALSHVLVSRIDKDVAPAYFSQKKIDKENKILQTNVRTFSKQTMQWLMLVEDFNTAVKELGDVENWARSLENDMRQISSHLESVFKAEK